MAKALNAIWRFFASIKLALISLFILAGISIIGTLIKQGEAPAYYVQEYGPNLARFFEVLHIQNMYHSWWFALLLCVFAVNIVVCSIKRLPDVWHIVVQDNLAIAPERLEKMGFRHRADAGLTVAGIAERMQASLVRSGWGKPRRHDGEGYCLFFVHTGAWSRFGVYVVHLSILFILAGAIIGTFFGYKAYVFLPEGRSTDTIFLQGSGTPVPLGFELQCERLEMSYYPNGMVKQSRVDLTVNDSDRNISFQQSNIVNDPLTYGGLTFYQADSYPLDEFFVVVRNRSSGTEQAFRVPPDRDVDWPGTDVSFRIEEIQQNEEGVVQKARIHFTSAGATEPSVFWLADKGTETISHPPAAEFTFSYRQLNTILFLVTKDPGVLIVYSGCVLMLAGLAISFFLSHRRIWVTITPREESGTRILVSGTTNKNKPAFEKRFHKLVKHLEHDIAITPGEKRA
jgi:cytochrome c biogenesis protein